MDVFSDATLGERRIEWQPPIMQHGPWPKPTNIYAKRAGKLVIWRRVEALGAALVIERCVGGDVDIRSVVLEFLESGLVLTMNDRPYPAYIGSAPDSYDITFTSNIPDGWCYSCRRPIVQVHDDDFVFELDSEPAGNWSDCAVECRFCAPWESECSQGFVRLVPELARATRLWREAMAARCADPERRNDWFHASDFLNSGSYAYSDREHMFWTVIAKHPPALEAMKAAGWERERFPDESGRIVWRCHYDTSGRHPPDPREENPFGGAAAAAAAARAASANAAAEAAARARDAEVSRYLRSWRELGHAAAGGAVTGGVLAFFFGGTA